MNSEYPWQYQLIMITWSRHDPNTLSFAGVSDLKNPWETYKQAEILDDIYPLHADYLIIGGGIMGASVGYWLGKFHPGSNIVVLEKDTTFTQVWQLWYAKLCDITTCHTPVLSRETISSQPQEKAICGRYLAGVLPPHNASTTSCILLRTHVLPSQPSSVFAPGIDGVVGGRYSAAVRHRREHKDVVVRGRVPPWYSPQSQRLRETSRPSQL